MNILKLYKTFLLKDESSELSQYNEEQQTIQYLLSNHDVNKDEAKKVVYLLGSKDAIDYSKWFDKTSFDQSLYLFLAASISNGIVDLKQLKDLERSQLEIAAGDYVTKFGLTTKQLEQTGYTRFDKTRGIVQNADSPNRERHLHEHLFGRLDRLED